MLQFMKTPTPNLPINFHFVLSKHFCTESAHHRTHTHTLAAFLQIMACSGTLQTMITFENSNMAFLILHGHKVTTRIP